MSVAICGRLGLHFQKDAIVAFFPLLQRGFYIEITTINLLEMLCRSCGLDPVQVRDRIQTIFLNGKPVDDIACAQVGDGDCLALSAAMPGLVGATMRSGGILAGFRQSISHCAVASETKPGGGILMIKLFNLLIKEIGPHMLRQGVLVPPQDLRNFLAGLSQGDWKDCIQAQWNAENIDSQTLATMDWPKGPGFVRLEVTFAQP